jgi:hypothetical protein
MSALPWLSLAWGQKPQFALHLPFLYVIRYAVVGAASSFPFENPRTMAEPEETRIFLGNSWAIGNFHALYGCIK